LLTDQSPQQIFELIRSFDARLNEDNGGNSVARILSPTPVTGVGDRMKFELKLNVSDFCGIGPLICVPQMPFTVTVKRYEPAQFTMSAVTMSDHPLAGWRYWRVAQTAPGEVLIETGAVDTTMGVESTIGPWLNFLTGAKTDQVKIWKEYLLDIQRRLGAARANDPNYGDDKLNGVWNSQAPPKSYLLTGICGGDTTAFCWYAQ
jgi:hypothetical protein